MKDLLFGHDDNNPFWLNQVVEYIIVSLDIYYMKSSKSNASYLFPEKTTTDRMTALDRENFQLQKDIFLIVTFIS